MSPQFDPTEFCGMRAMRSGNWYLPYGREFEAEQRRSARLVRKFNRLGNTRPRRAQRIIQRLTRADHADTEVLAPTFIEFGENLTLGRGVFINAGATILSSARVTIGARSMLGPDCQLITVFHPLDDVAMRRGGWERTAPIEIGEDVWLGAGVTVLPGVTIGSGTTVGARATVTRSLPENCVAMGTPARVTRRLDPARRERGELPEGAPLAPEPPRIK